MGNKLNIKDKHIELAIKETHFEDGSKHIALDTGREGQYLMDINPAMVAVVEPITKQGRSKFTFDVATSGGYVTVATYCGRGAEKRAMNDRDWLVTAMLRGKSITTKPEDAGVNKKKTGLKFAEIIEHLAKGGLVRRASWGKMAVAYFGRGHMLMMSEGKSHMASGLSLGEACG